MKREVRIKMRKLGSLVVVALFCLAPVALLASNGSPGNGGGDPQIFEGIVNTGFGLVESGDVVICEFGASCVYSLTNTSGWSDVLVFYDTQHGPFSSDVYGTADSAVMFSDDGTGFYSLANFLANTQGLSSNGLVGATEDAAGNWVYGGYYGNSPEVPEPSSIALLGTALAGAALRGYRKFAQK